MVDHGRADREIVESVIKDLDDYVQFVSEEFSIMRRELDHLADDWKDNQYSVFCDRVNQITDDLQTGLDKLDLASEFLKNKLKVGYG